MRIIKILIIVLLLLPMLTHSQEVNNKSFEAFFETWKTIENAGVVGGAIKDGELIFLKAYGSSDLENNKKNTTTTKFQVDDLAKQFTVFSVLLLKKEGKLSLEDDVRKYLSYLPKYKYDLKVKHLLNHSSGLHNVDLIKEILGISTNDVFTQKDAVELISTQTALNFRPGTDFSHHRSDTEIILLAEIVAKVSGTSFEVFTKEHIFKPLGMINTLFSTSRKILDNTAKSYQINKEVIHNPINNLTLGATNLYTTAEDFAKWNIIFMNPKTDMEKLVKELDAFVRLDSGKTLKSSWGELMYGRYYDHLERGLASIWQFGISGGYAANLFRFHTKNFTSFVLGNNNRYNGMPAMSMAYEYLKDDFPKSEAIDFSILDVQKLSSEELKIHEGFYYKNDNGLVREIYVKNDTLRYKRLENNIETALIPLGKNRFQFMLQSDDVVTVDFSENAFLVTSGIGNPTPFNKYTPSKKLKNEFKFYIGLYYNKELDITYTIKEKEDYLVAKTLRNGETKLFYIEKEIFRTNTLMLSKIEFEKETENTIKAFKIDTDGIKNLYFEKLK